MRSGSRLVDADARRNAAGDLENSYIIEAGAGTGKTTILLERVENLVLQLNVPLSEIVIITFTEKAAAELKMKLRDKLEELYADPKHAVIIERALEEYEKCIISTIHSFAASMLRERPVEAKIDPGFEVSDDLTSSLLFDEIWQEWLEREMEGSPDALRKALNFGAKLATIKEIAERIIVNRDIRQGRPQMLGVSAGDFFRVLAGHVDELKRIAADHCTSDEDKGFRQIVEIAENLERVRGFDEEKAQREICEFKVKANRGARTNWSDPSQLERVRAIFEEVSAAIETFRGQITQDICAGVAEWLDGFIEFFAAEKKKRGYLDFEDLLIHARDMLRDNHEVRKYFQDKFRYILVDEFQDTDPLQTEIVFFLSEKDPVAERWEDVLVRRGKLFIVGDPKQSVYRFRRADIEIYSQAKERLLEDGKEENIVVNFRTVPSITDWVNALFGDLMKKQEGEDFQVDYLPIKAERKEEAETSQVVLLYPPAEIGEDGTAETKIDEIRQMESIRIASLVWHAVGEGRWKVRDKKKDSLRDARYSDVAILFRKTTGIDLYEEALRSFDIPYRIVGGKHFFMKQEVMSLIAAMKAIDNPSDRASVVAALRSEFFGHSDEEIFFFRESGGDFNYARMSRDDSAVGSSLAIMRELHQWRNKREIPVSLMDLFAKTKALELFYLKPQGEQRVANLLKIIAMARLHENVSISSFKSFTMWLEEMLAEEREGEESPVSEAEDDAVRVMTIHKAKGLEFPIVIIAGLESGIRKEERFIVDRRRARFEFALGELKPMRFLELKDLEEKRQEAEEQRIFYVAATRARDTLVLPVFPKKWQNGFIRYLAGRIPENRAELRGKEILDPPVFFFDDTLLGKGKRELRPFRIDFDEGVLKDAFSEIIGKRDILLTSLAELKRSAGGGLRIVSATSLKEEAMEERAAGALYRRSRGAEIGKAVHEVLAEIDLDRPDLMGTGAMKRSIEMKYPGISSEVCSLVEKALRTDTVKDAARSRRCMREVPFSIHLDSVILEGSIDMIFEKDGEFIAVDYKTDDVKESEALEERMKKYEIQAAIYSYAFSFIHGIAPKEIRFVFLNAEKEKKIIIGPGIIERGKSLAMNDTMQIAFET